MAQQGGSGSSSYPYPSSTGGPYYPTSTSSSYYPTSSSYHSTSTSSSQVPGGSYPYSQSVGGSQQPYVTSAGGSHPYSTSAGTVDPYSTTASSLGQRTSSAYGWHQRPSSSVGSYPYSGNVDPYAKTFTSNSHLQRSSSVLGSYSGGSNPHSNATAGGPHQPHMSQPQPTARPRRTASVGGSRQSRVINEFDSYLVGLNRGIQDLETRHKRTMSEEPTLTKKRSLRLPVIEDESEEEGPVERAEVLPPRSKSRHGYYRKST